MLRRNCFGSPVLHPSRHQRRERPMLIGVAKQAQDIFVIESRPKFDFPGIISKHTTMSNVNIHTYSSVFTLYELLALLRGQAVQHMRVRLMATCRNRESDSPSYTGTHRERTSQFRAMSAVGPRDGPERHVAGAPARFRLRVLRGLVHQRAEVVVHRQHRDDARRSKTFPGVTVRVGLAFYASRFAVRGGRLGGRPRSDSGFALAEACVHRDWCPTPRRKIPTESTLTSVSL